MAFTGEVSTRRPALDGLRGVAILLVVVGHGFPDWVPSAGQVGVSVFFVLSGYLITGPLLAEHGRGRVDLRAFYRRRAVRILPTLAAFLGVMTLLSVLVSHRYATPGALLAAWFYLGNWTLALGHPTGVVDHMWSLAIEEQFYIAFPACALLLMRKGGRWLLVACSLAAAASAVWRVALWLEGAPWQRVYAGTDTALAPILLGCALAAAVQHYPLPVRREWAAPALVAMLALGAVGDGAASRTLVPLAAAGLAAVALLALRDQATAPAWLQLVGRRSYALYLWNAPLIWLVAPASPWPLVPTVAAVGAGSWLLTLASWRYVEEPLMERYRSANHARPTTRRPVHGPVSHGARDAADATPAAAVQLA